MSQENVELVRRAFELFNQGGVPAAFSSGLMSPELVFDPSASGIPGAGVYRGRDEVWAFFEEDWFEAFPFDEWELEVEELIDHGDQVFAMTRQRGRGASSGVAAELVLANIFTLRDGEVVRIELYRDRERALEVAGLSPAPPIISKKPNQ
ncbi:MAG: nuclear transport factor 2 family protein [Actinomycetota bacterium]